MGDKWEVYAWVPSTYPSKTGYAYEMVYRGESAVGALVAAWRAKRSGAGCVRLEWR